MNAPAAKGPRDELSRGLAEPKLGRRLKRQARRAVFALPQRPTALDIGDLYGGAGEAGGKSAGKKGSLSNASLRALEKARRRVRLLVLLPWLHGRNPIDGKAIDGA